MSNFIKRDNEYKILDPKWLLISSKDTQTNNKINILYNSLLKKGHINIYIFPIVLDDILYFITSSNILKDSIPIYKYALINKTHTYIYVQINYFKKAEKISIHSNRRYDLNLTNKKKYTKKDAVFLSIFTEY